MKKLRKNIDFFIKVLYNYIVLRKSTRKELRKMRLKKRVKLFLIGLAIVATIIQIGFSLDAVSLDELGNTCYGTIIKVCGRIKDD